MRRLLAAAAAMILACPASALAAPARASLTDLEQQVMCVTCGVPLAIAESPQAERERAYIRTLIAQNQDSAQIKRTLVAQYGPQVLALPRAKGFDLAVYLVPVLLVLVLVGALALALPRWRARRPEQPAAPLLSGAEQARLDEDLARYRD